MTTPEPVVLSATDRATLLDMLRRPEARHRLPDPDNLAALGYVNETFGPTSMHVYYELTDAGRSMAEQLARETTADTTAEVPDDRPEMRRLIELQQLRIEALETANEGLRISLETEIGEHHVNKDELAATRAELRAAYALLTFAAGRYEGDES